MVLRHGLLLSAVGVALGLVASAGLSRLMGSLLFGVSATDPLTYGLVALALIGVAAIASLIPAVRASAVDPGSALRLE
jgi:ABC-type antimicrobial peptide transport system permease subunit